MNRKAKTLLVLALVAVVGMAFRVSWNALRDIAKAIGADDTAATLYPFVVDGLMALALVAALVLTDEARRFALRVLAGYTLASLVLNYVHGLLPELHAESIGWSRLADGDLTNWALVLLATSLPVGSIYFGSDLVAKVLHHRPAIESSVQESAQIDVNRSMSEQGEPVVEESAPGVEVDSSPPSPSSRSRRGRSSRWRPSRRVLVGRPVGSRRPLDRVDRSARTSSCWPRRGA